MLKKILQWDFWARFFFKLFLLTFPLQVQTLLYKADWFSGQFNYFVAFFLTASEVFLFLAFVFWAINMFWLQPTKEAPILPNRWGDLLLTALAVLVFWSLLSVFWAGDKTLALLYALRWLEFGLIVFLLGQEVLKRETVLTWLFWGIFAQVLIGLGQYLRQSDLGLVWLGEPRLGADYLNIAKIDLGGERILRSYGTFAHANVFGGVLFLCLTLLIKGLEKQNYLKYAHFLVIFLVGLLISFSRSAWLAFFIFLTTLWAMKAVRINWRQLLLTMVLLTFVMVVFSLDQVILSRILNFSMASWDERLIFSSLARNMIGENYLLGVGAGNFVQAMPLYDWQNLSPWLFQPVHNFLLLAITELGLPGILLWLTVGAALFQMAIFCQHRKPVSERFSAKAWLGLLSGLILLLLLDHYFYTIWAGQAMLAVLMGILLMEYRERQRQLAE